MRRLLCAAALAGAAAGAGAADLPLWELGMGAGVLQLPHYRGSDQSHTWLLPVPYVVYRGQIFKADREGARALLYETPRLTFDLSAGASAPANSRDDVARRGMEDLPPAVEIGPNANWTLARDTGWKLDLRLPVRNAITVQRSPRSIGLVSTPNLNLDLHDVGGWHLGLQAALVYANRRYNAHFYEVKPSEALPDRPAYAASGGYGGAQFIVATSRRIGRLWAGGFVKYDTLHGATFADSPLVRQRSQWSGGIALSWVFAVSGTSVSREE